MKIDKFYYNRIKNIIFDTIEQLVDDDDIENGMFCGDNYYQKNYDDVENDIKKLKKELKKQGIDLFEFISKHEEQVFSDFGFEYNSAFVDSILYSYDNKKGILSGSKLEGSENQDFFMKYNYGFYTYDMGKKYILQSYASLDDYYKETSEKLFLGYLDRNITGDSNKISNLCSITKKYTDGYTIYIHLNSLYLLNVLYNDDDNSYDEFISKFKSNISPIPHKMFDGIFEIYIKYRKNPISMNEFNDIQRELNIKHEDVLDMVTAKKYNL